MTTDFEERAIETMLQAGISMAHIQAQKRTFFQTLPVDNYYNEIENSEEPNLEIFIIKKMIAIFCKKMAPTVQLLRRCSMRQSYQVS